MPRMRYLEKTWVLVFLVAAAGAYGLVKVLTAEHPGLEAASLVIYLAGGLAVGWVINRVFR